MRSACILAIVAAAAGCVPVRDNPSDPTNAPQVRLAVVDYTAADGTCTPGFGPGQSWPQVAAVSRGRCLALDAGASADPRGFALTAWSFALLDTAGNVAKTLATASASSTFVLGSSMRLSLPVDRALTFAATVEDSSGYRGAGTGAVVLLDAKPVAVADASRTLTLHGDPWAWDSPILLNFDASRSHDADGDPLTYCWTFPDATAEQCTGAKVVTHAVPVTTAGRYVVKLRVKDNPRISDAETEVIRIDEAPVWIEDAGSYERIDVRQNPIALPTPGPGQSVAQQLAFPLGAIVAEFTTPVTGNSFATAAPYPAANTFDFPGPSPFSAPVALFGPGEELLVAPVVSSSGSQVAFLGALGGNVTLAAVAMTFTAGNPMLVAEPHVTIAPLTALGNLTPVRFAGDGAGNWWIGSAENLSMLPHGTTTATTDADPTRIVSDLAARPGTNEMWVARSPNENAGSTAHGILMQWTGGAHLDTPIPGDYALALGWANSDELWIATATQLLLEDARLLSTGATIDQASILALDGISQAQAMFVDPVTGTCWLNAHDAVDGTAIVVRAETDGRVFRAPASPSYPVAVDPEFGALWFAGNIPVRTFTPNRSTGVAARTYARNDNLIGAQNDSHTGGIVAPVTEPHALARIGFDADLDIEASSTAGALPFISDMRASSDAERLWVLDANGNPYLGDLRLIKPGTTPPEESVVLSAATIDAIFTRPAVLVPSSMSTPPFAWYFRRTNTPHDISTISTSGTLTTVHTISATQENSGGEIPASAALFPSDDSRCFGSADQGANPAIHILHVQTPNTANEIATPHGTLLHVASSSEAGVDLCWVAYQDGTTGAQTIIAVDALGAIVHSTTVPNLLLEIRPTSNDVLWVETDLSTNYRLDRIEFKAGQVSAILQDLSTAISNQAFLIRNGAEY